MTLEEQLEFQERYVAKAYAACLRDFKARKDEIIGEQRALVMEGALGDPARDSWLIHHELHRRELEGFAQAVAARLAKMRRGWS